MMTVNIYLNYEGKSEEAFNFYKSVFGGEFAAVMRIKDMPGNEHLPAAEQEMIMHISLPISDTTMLMATDFLPSMENLKLIAGNNHHISLSPDSEAEARRLFNGLSAGGNITMPLEKMVWGALYGSFTDKYGINWMINFDVN